MATFQGPTRPSTDKSKFKKTGESSKKFQGPTRPSTDTEKFRSSGESKKKKKKSKSRRRSRSRTVPTPEPVFSGPTRPSTDIDKFKQSGVVEKKKPFQGPTRKTTNIEKFRRSGTVKKKNITKIPEVKFLTRSKEDLIKDIKKPKFQGPTRLTTDKKKFTETGKVTLKQIIQGATPPSQPPKEIFNTLGIAPKKNVNKYIKLENFLYDEFIRIQKKNVNNRTDKEMALIGLYGVSSTALKTLRKIPQATWDTIVLILRPDIIVKAIIKLSTDSKSRSDVNTQLIKFGSDLQKADPKAVSTLVSTLAGIKAGNKILSETVKVASVTKPVRIVKEALFIRSQPKELKPFIKAILKGARVQENLKPVDLKGLKKINFNEVKELNKIEAIALKKTLQTTDSFVFGSLPARTLSKGKTKIPKDVDLATRNIKKFQESFIKNLPKSIRKDYIQGKEFIRKGNVKILDIKAYDRLRPDQTIFGTGRLPINAIIYSSQGKKLLKTSGLKIPTKSLLKIEGVKIVGFGEQTSRKALGTLQVILEKSGRRAKDPAAFIESLEIQLKGLQGKIPKAKFVNKFLLNIKAKDLQNSLKILKSKKFLKLLDKQVPGLTKEFPIILKINKLTSKDKLKISNKVDTKIKQINKSKGIIKPKLKVKSKKSSKGSQMPRSSKIPKSKIPRSSKIPKSKIPRSSKIPKSRIPGSRIPGSRILRASKIPQSRIPQSRMPKSSKIPPASTSRIPTAPSGKSIPIPPKQPPKKKSRFTFNSGLPKGSRLKFDVRFKSKGKLKEIRIGLPQNKALRKLSDAIDNTLPRSAELFISGITKTKDVNKPSLGKFRVGKTLRTLKLVEKTKFALDTKGEKKGLSLARALKPRKKKKIIKIKNLL